MIFTPACTSSSATCWAAVGGHGDHADHDLLLLHHQRQLGGRAHGQVLAHRRADLLRVGVEQRHDPEAVVGEDAGARRWPGPGGRRRTARCCAGRWCAGSCGSARPASPRCSPPRACRTCRSRTGRAGSGWSSRACSRPAPGRRWCPCPSSWPGSAPGGSATAGRPRRWTAARPPGRRRGRGRAPWARGSSRPHSTQHGPHGAGVEAQLEHLLAVDGQHRHPLAVLAVQARVQGNVEYLELEPRPRPGPPRTSA